MKKLLATLALMLLPFHAHAAWPEKSITLIVPYAAGGMADASGRLIAREMEKRLGVNIIVKNVVGATGTLGAAEMARAKADGYTLGWFPPGPVAGMPNMRSLPYTKDDLLPLGMMFDEVAYFATAKNAPWQTLDELVHDVKAHPGTYCYGAPGRGGAVHLSIYAIIKALGLDCRFVPERSNADILKAIAGGTTHFHAAPATELQRFDLKAFFVVDSQRSEAFPDIPTAAELGYTIPRITNWMGLFAPKGLPQEFVQRLSDELGNIARDPAFNDSARQMSCTVSYLPHDAFLGFYDEQYALYATLLKEILDK